MTHRSTATHVARAIAALALAFALPALGARDRPGRVASRSHGARPPAAGAGSQAATFTHAWTRIRDTYPYPDMKGLDWQGVHDELLPRAQAARTPAELRPVLLDMLSRLGESHFQVIPSEAYASLERIEKAGRADKADRSSKGRSARRGAGKEREDEAGDEAEDEAADADDEAGEEDDRGDLGLEVRIMDGRAIVSRVDPGGPADLAGIRTGFVLTSINGTDIAAALADADANLAAMGHAGEKHLAGIAALAAVTRGLSGRPGSVATLELLHGQDRKVRVELERRTQPGELNRLGQLPPIVVDVQSEVLGGDVGYVRFNIFLVPVAPRFDGAMADFIARNVKGVVIDLRGNPGGLGGMVMGMAGHFIDEPGRSLGRMKLRGAELDFNANPRLEVFHGPVAILVDELSMSTSELFAAGMKGLGRARVFGTRSPGMALPSVIEALPNGDRLQFVMADLLDPAGRRIEGQGVEPDEAVQLTRASLLSGKDDVIERAIAWIRGGGAASAAAVASAD